jgi:hypothetical protein
VPAFNGKPPAFSVHRKSAFPAVLQMVGVKANWILFGRSQLQQGNKSVRWQRLQQLHGRYVLLFWQLSVATTPATATLGTCDKQPTVTLFRDPGTIGTICGLTLSNVLNACVHDACLEQPDTDQVRVQDPVFPQPGTTAESTKTGVPGLGHPDTVGKPVTKGSLLEGQRPENAGGQVMLIVAMHPTVATVVVAEQPLASVTVSEYEPAATPFRF